jgi:hypothetical protein
MRINLLKFLLVGVLLLLFSTKKASAASVVFTGLAGNSPIYLTQGATNDVVFGFSVFVPAGGTFNPGTVHIAQTNNTNGFVSGNLIRTTAATPSLAISSPVASYGATINSTIDINSFPTLTGAAGTGTTYYFYLVVSVTVNSNPPPASVVFSLPSSASVSQNGYSGGITINNIASPTTYYFGVNPPTSPGGSNCGPGTVSLTASDASPSGGTYAWYAAATGGLPIATGATYSPSISATTTYYVSYTYGAVTSTRTAVTATINPVASATFTSSASIIAGSSPTITYTGTDPATSTYAWSFTGGSPATSSGQSPAAVTYTTPGTYTISLTVTNSAGCSATTNNSITVTAAPPTSPGGSTCGPGVVALTASDVTSGGTYSWYAASTGGSALATGATYSPTISATTTYYVSFTYGASTSTRTAVTATVAPVPSSSFTITSSVVTGGNAVTNYTGGDPTTSTYTWNFNGGTIISGSGQGPYTIQWSTAGTKNVTLTVTNSAGCSSTVTTQSVTVQQLVAPTPASFANCGAGIVTLTPTGGSPSGGTYNYYYTSTGGTAFRSSSLSTYTPNLVATTTYYVSYTYGGVESARSAITATINPIVSAPYSGAFFSYPFSGNTNDVSSYGNNGSNNAATLTTDRYGSSNAAYSFNGSSSFITDPFVDNDPTSYTISIWFSTTTTTGGPLIGLENSSYYADRVLYMSNSGQLYWGLYPGTVQTINTTLSYNDGNWHHAVVTVSSGGSTLYVDGASQASSTAMTLGNSLDGNWVMGYSIISPWTNAPSSNYFSGKLDDIAVYHRVLSTTEISTSNDVNQIYAGSATACSALTFNAPTIAGATYTWKDPNNATQTGQSVSFPGAVAGNYTLTVTGGAGGCSSTATIIPVVYGSGSAAFNVAASIPVNIGTTVSLYSGNGSSTYSWNFGGGTSSSGTTGQGPFTVQWSSTGVKTITLTVTTSGGCSIVTTHTITVTSTAYGNYTYSRTITLNNKAVGISSNLSSFPVLLTIQNNDLIVSGTCNDKIQNPTSNYDFAFYDPSAQSELYYQIESYNSTTGTLLVWVRVPTLYAATNNTLSFYYGSKVPPVTHNAAFFANTWNADYQAVYHFNESAYSSTTADGTANGRTATLAGFQSSDYVAAGKIGSCYTFGGTSGSSSANDMEAPSTAPSSVFTLSAWVNTSNTGLDEKILTDQSAGGTASGGYKLGVYFSSAETEGDYNGNRAYNTPAEPALSANTWYYVQGVYDGTTMSTYVNGVQYKNFTVTATSTFTNTLFIGIGESKQYPFSGMIDEPRVSTAAKSSDWIKMEYVNQNNPTAFIISTSTASVNVTNGAAISGELSYTWNGGTTNPATGSNWTNTVTGTTGTAPAFDGSASIIIPGGLANYFTLPANAALYGLTMGNGATLNLGGYILSVGCHIYNGSGGQILYGSSSANGGITFNGSLATQYYYGSTTGGIANVANLTVNNSAGGTVDITGGAFGVNNVLTLTNGNLLIDNAGNGSLTLLSSATNSASVAAIPTGFAITGNVNVQRYITNGTGTRGYRLLSSPVNVNSSITGANTSLGLTYLNTNATFNSTTYYGAYTQGPGTGFNLNNSVHPIIYIYDETQATYNRSFTGGKNIGIYSITGATGSPAYGVITQGATVASTAINLPTATSYLLYFVGSDQSTSVATTRVPDATTLTATGYLNQGTIPFVFWKTGSTSLPHDVTSGTTNYGIFQVGNPYPSTINLVTLFNDNYSAGSNAIGSAFYELIPAGNYVSYNASNGAVSDLRASNYIVSGQGFLAQTTAAGQTLTFKEDQKTTYSTSATLLESIRTPTPTLSNAHIINSIPSSAVKGRNDELQVNTNSVNAGLHVQMTLDSANYAQTGIYFKNTATDKYVSSEDAVEIDGGTPQVFLSSYSSDSVKLSINTMADYGQGKRIRLYANANYSGTYTLSLADLTGIDTTDYNIYLVDNKLADSLDLVHSKTYSFTLNTADTTTFGSNRFVLAVDHKAVKQYQLATFTGQKVSTGVQLKWTAVNAGNYTGYTLQKLNADGGYDSLYSVQSDTSTTAYNFIDTHPIIGNNTYRLAQNGITGAITYSAVVTIGYNSSTPNGALTVYPNPAQSIININIPSSTISSPNYVADIYNASGQIVNHQTVTNSSWSNDVSSYKLGLYVLQVKDTNGNIVGVAKFIKVE